MNACADPEAYTDPENEDSWANQHARFIADTLPGDINVIFIGDFVVEELQLTEIWTKWFVPLKSLNFGIGDDLTQNVLWRVLHGELDHCKVKAVVLCVGTNNHGSKPHDIAEGILKIAKLIKMKQEACTVVLLSLLPRCKVPNITRDRNAQVNEIVKNGCTQIPECMYLNITNGIVQQDETISHHIMYDYLHLTAQGYERVFEPVYKTLMLILSDSDASPSHGK